MSKNLLEIKDLEVKFYTYEGIVEAIDKVKLNIKNEEILGLVGETGCGKSVTSLSILVIVPPPGRIEGGKINLEAAGGKVELLSQKEAFLRGIRGEEISMIFQEPRAFLNPVYTVENQITEALMHHRQSELVKRVLQRIEEELKHTRSSRKRRSLRNAKRLYTRMAKNPKSLYIRFLSKIPIIRRFRKRLNAEAKREVVRILGEMKIPDPERVAEMYPHELSGGMAQRVVIAMALGCEPRLLIADEPTTNLDVTVQAQILVLIRELKDMFKSSVLYITHDLGVVAELCDRVAVMYAGNVAEVADVMELFKKPLHPYTKGLLESIPRPGKEFKTIKGEVPALINPPAGCRFHTRCPTAMEICTMTKPEFIEADKDHFVMCHLYKEVSD